MDLIQASVWNQSTHFTDSSLYCAVLVYQRTLKSCVVDRLAFGNDCGLAIIDIVQKTCLLSMGTPDLYGKLPVMPCLTACHSSAGVYLELLTSGGWPQCQL